MQLTAEVLMGLGTILAVIVTALVVFHSKAPEARAPRRPLSRGPASLRFTCEGCSEQFTHNKRTQKAWEKGTRRFFCNACHRKWRELQPTAATQGARNIRSALPPSDVGPISYSSKSGSFAKHAGPRPTPGTSGRGCLTVAVLFVGIPIAVVY